MNSGPLNNELYPDQNSILVHIGPIFEKYLLASEKTGFYGILAITSGFGDRLTGQGYNVDLKMLGTWLKKYDEHDAVIEKILERMIDAGKKNKKSANFQEIVHLLQYVNACYKGLAEQMAYTVYLPDTNARIFSVFSTVASRFKKMAKRILKAYPDQEKQATFCLFVNQLCASLDAASGAAHTLGNTEASIYLNIQLVHWLTYGEHLYDGYVNTLVNTAYKEPIRMDKRSHIRDLTSNANLALYRSYKNKGLIVASLPFMKKFIMNAHTYKLGISTEVSLLLKDLKDRGQEWYSLEICDLTLALLNRIEITKLIPEYQAEVLGLRSRMEAITSEMKGVLIHNFTAIFEPLSWTSLTVKAQQDSLVIDISASIDITQSDIHALLGRVIKNGIKVTLENHQLVVSSYLYHDPVQLKEFVDDFQHRLLRYIEKRTTEDESASMPQYAVADIIPHFAQVNLSSSSSSSCSSTDPIPERKSEKVKTKGDVVSVPSTTPVRPPEPRREPRTKHELGFHFPCDDKTPVYEIHGDTVPKAVYFAYCDFRNDRSLKDHERRHHQEIIERGLLVPSGDMGLRYMRNGFKTAIPGTDLRGVLVKVDEVLVNGQMRYLYRAADMMTHQEIKRYKLENR